LTVENFSSKLDLLLTECPGHIGEYLPQVVAVQTEHNVVHSKITMGKHSPVRLKQTRFISN